MIFLSRAVVIPTIPVACTGVQEYLCFARLFLVVRSIIAEDHYIPYCAFPSRRLHSKRRQSSSTQMQFQSRYIHNDRQFPTFRIHCDVTKIHLWCIYKNLDAQSYDQKRVLPVLLLLLHSIAFNYSYAIFEWNNLRRKNSCKTHFK